MSDKTFTVKIGGALWGGGEAMAVLGLWVDGTEGWGREGEGKSCAGAKGIAMRLAYYGGNESNGADRPWSNPYVRLYPYSPFGCAGHRPTVTMYRDVSFPYGLNSEIWFFFFFLRYQLSVADLYQHQYVTKKTNSKLKLIQ